jgi:hypothetical protein
LDEAPYGFPASTAEKRVQKAQQIKGYDEADATSGKVSSNRQQT